MNLSCPFRGTDFEHKLKVKKIAGDSCRQSISIFTESLILAQDERWRRA